ncbi:MAG: L,D-transpeptidase [Stigonema ocellatum SAG 48.90 = DSM 106950]|nr:L,D-transpeptidase [Stigonema ocellatum SAG 48.90 = DSM 106950]
MAMVRNESVARMVMWLCFGTAILSLAVHWRMTASIKSDSSSQTSDNSSGTSRNAIAMGATSAQTSSQSVQGSQQNAMGNSPLKSLFTQGSDQQKSSTSLAPNQMQVVVDLNDRRVYVYRQDLVIASYPIAVGKKGWETPTGSFQVINKQTNPLWRHPITGRVFPSGPDSPLGDRWIGFWSDGRNQIGFHGTPEIELVGSAISHGCLRMRNPDVRLLYKQIKMGTSVIVRR